MMLHEYYMKPCFKCGQIAKLVVGASNTFDGDGDAWKWPACEEHADEKYVWMLTSGRTDAVIQTIGTPYD